LATESNPELELQGHFGLVVARPFVLFRELAKLTILKIDEKTDGGSSSTIMFDLSVAKHCAHR